MERNVKRRLLPSKRPKKRYVAFEVITEQSIPISRIKQAINDALIKGLGAEKMQQANINVFENRFDKEKKRGIVRTTPKYLRDVVKILNNMDEASIKTLGVSGTINKAYEKYIAS